MLHLFHRRGPARHQFLRVGAGSPGGGIWPAAFLDDTQRFFSLGSRAANDTLMPSVGQVRVYLRTFEGTFSAEIQEVDAR